MAIKYRADDQSVDFSQIPQADSDSGSIPGEILASGQTGVPTVVLTDGSMLPTKSFTSFSTPSLATTIISQSFANTSSTPSAAAASSKGSGLSHGAIAAIVVPIAFLAILVPILVFWCLGRKHKTAAAKRSSHRSSKEAMLQKQSSIQKRPHPKGPKPARPERTPPRSAIDPPTIERRNSLGLFNFELSPPSTPGMGWMTPNPRFSVARALSMRRSQPSVVQSQPRASRGESLRPQTKTSECSQRPQTKPGLSDPPPPYARDAALPKPTPYFAPLERIGTLQHTERSHGPIMQPAARAPTLPAFTATNGSLDVQHLTHAQHSPRASSEILQLPDAYGRVYTRSPSPDLSMYNTSSLSGPFSYTARARLSDISVLSDEPEPWGRMRRDTNESLIISPLDNDERYTIHPHQVL